MRTHKFNPNNAIGLTAEQHTLILRTLHQAWGAIAWECEGIEDNAGAIEMCVDADRLKDYNVEAYNLVNDLVRKHGWAKVLNVLDHMCQVN